MNQEFFNQEDNDNNDRRIALYAINHIKQKMD